MMSDKYPEAALLAMLHGDAAPAPGRLNLVSRSEATMDAIKRIIIARRLAPGESLPTEGALCAELGVSRSSVREALRRLEALDIVTVQQGRGAFVGHMSLKPLVETLILRGTIDAEGNRASLHQVVETRRFLDLGVAEAVVSARRDPRDNAHLHRLVESMVARASAGKQFMDDDVAFHDGLLSGLGNDLVCQFTRAMWLVHMAIVPSMGREIDKRLVTTARAHGDMLQAAEAGDVEAYRVAVNAHYAPIAEIIADM